MQTAPPGAVFCCNVRIEGRLRYGLDENRLGPAVDHVHHDDPAAGALGVEKHTRGQTRRLDGGDNTDRVGHRLRFVFDERRLERPV